MARRYYLANMRFFCFTLKKLSWISSFLFKLRLQCRKATYTNFESSFRSSWTYPCWNYSKFPLKTFGTCASWKSWTGTTGENHCGWAHFSFLAGTSSYGESSNIHDQQPQDFKNSKNMFQHMPQRGFQGTLPYYKTPQAVLGGLQCGTTVVLLEGVYMVPTIWALQSARLLNYDR